MQKSKRSGLLWLFSISLILISLFSFTDQTYAQAQDDADFIVTLALMAVADDRLDGVMDLSALSNLRAEVDDYYTQKSYLQMDADTKAALNHQKDVVLSALDNKIDFQNALSYRAQIDPVSWRWSMRTTLIIQGIPKVTRMDIFPQVMTTGHKPDPEAVAMLQQRLAGSTSSAVEQDLDANLAANVERGADIGQLEHGCRSMISSR